ncbi:MAG: MMPL family transporter, partial [Rubripirellula sp.]
MASGNIQLLQFIEAMLEDAKATFADWPSGLQLGMSGSAAVGSDILQSAKESISNTELYTVILVVVILMLVYRSPLLVAVPLISIGVSLAVSTGLVAELTTLGKYPGMEWWNFKIFTTTKIFVVVILFGAGTDYCLFLIARFKEELEAGENRASAITKSLGGVGEALAASALTTILGLATMFFADFGKFRNSGPAIGLCLLVTLLACLTLAPALLHAFGKTVYWTPFQRKGTAFLTSKAPSRLDRMWEWLADVIVAKPGLILMSSTLLMLHFFLMGFNVAITYDLLSELHPDRVSKRGAVLLQRHFPVGESGPVILLAHKPNGDFESTEGTAAIRELTTALRIDGVNDVRSLVAPVGGKPKSSAIQILRQNHRISRELYVSSEPSLNGGVTRLELILAHDPFSLEATEVLEDVDEKLAVLAQEPDSYWADSRFVFSGTTAAIRDLRNVTTSDNVRIQRLVVLAVFVILLLLLKRPAVCIYLILSVLFSYYVTIGATEQYFRWAYGDTFEGLDWKVPLFLFVILVAIGQDYNIYLATRVFEEQKEHGLFGGLR